jgi:hypothetical protein
MQYSKWEDVDRNLEKAELGIEPSDNEYISEQVGPEITAETDHQAAIQPTESEVLPVPPARASAPTESE